MLIIHKYPELQYLAILFRRHEKWKWSIFTTEYYMYYQPSHDLSELIQPHWKDSLAWVSIYLLHGKGSMKDRIIRINWHSTSIEENRAMWPSDTGILVVKVLVLFLQVGSFDKWPYLYTPQFPHLYNENNNAHFFCGVFWYILIESFIENVSLHCHCLVKRRDVARKLQKFLTSHNKPNAEAARDQQKQSYHMTVWHWGLYLDS